MEDHVNNEKSNPFFILLSSQSAHVPYAAPSEVIEKFNYIEDENRQQLAAVISVLDDTLGDIVGYLKSEESGYLWSNTMLIVSSDNGAPTVQHFDGALIQTGASNFPLRLVPVFVLLSFVIHVSLTMKEAERRLCGKEVSEPLLLSPVAGYPMTAEDRK